MRLEPPDTWEQYVAQYTPRPLCRGGTGTQLARDCDDLERLLDGWQIRHWRATAITHERRLLQRSEAA